MALCFLFSALIVALDQFFKQYIVRTIPIRTFGPDIIKDFFGLFHYENPGAMLGILENRQWLLAGIAFVAAVALVMILLRYDEGFWGTLGLAAVLGGTVGNLLDRIFNGGSVIDMFALYTVSETGTKTIWFPIFNIADIFITLGFLTFLAHFIALTVKTEAKKPVANTRSSAISGEGELQDEPDDDFQINDILPDYAKQDVEPAEDIVVTEEDVLYEQGDDIAYTQEAPVEYEPVYNEEAAVYDAITDTTPDVSYTADDLDLDLDIDLSDLDYDVDDLLKEYGIDDDDINV